MVVLHFVVPNFDPHPNSLIFRNPYQCFNFFYVFLNIVFEKKIVAIIVQLLVQSPGKFLCVIWNLGTKTYTEFVTLRLFFKIDWFFRIHVNFSFFFVFLNTVFEKKIETIIVQLLVQSSWIFQNPCEFFIFFRFSKYCFWKKNWDYNCTTVSSITQNFLCVIWNLGTKTYPKFVTLRLFLKNFKKVKTIEKIQMDSTKWQDYDIFRA